MYVLKLKILEFTVLCYDLESGAMDTCLFESHNDNIAFVNKLMSKFITYVNDNDLFTFEFELSDEDVDSLKEYVQWSYNESFDSWIHPEDKEAFLNLKSKIESI